LSAAVDAAEFHNPGRRAGVETSFAEALKSAGEIGSSHTQRQQVGDAGKSAAKQPGEKSDPASAAVGQRAGEKAGRQSDKRKSSNDEADGLIRSAEVVPDVRRQSRQHCSYAEKAEEGRSDNRPETRAKSLRVEPHEDLLYPSRLHAIQVLIDIGDVRVHAILQGCGRSEVWFGYALDVHEKLRVSVRLHRV
jgi:hypothetical protein